MPLASPLQMTAYGKKPPKAFGSYVRGKLLGKGAFAAVYACRKSDDEEQLFAVKAVDLQAMRLSGRGERELKKIQRESSILKRIKPHANVVRFVDLVEHDDWYLFILEYVQGGNLLESVTKRRGSEPLKEHEVRCIFRQLVDGIAHLHNEAIIHRDLKLENVLVVQEGSSKKEFKVKITDFGLSKEVGDGISAACSSVGSPKYVAPEVIAQGTHDFKADLWSLGILLFVLLGNRFPFDGNSQAAKEAQEEIDAELFRLPVSEPARSVLLGLLRIQADARLTLEQLKQHEWLSSASSVASPMVKRRRTPTSKQPVDAPSPPTGEATRTAPSAGEAAAAPIVEDLSDTTLQLPGGPAPPARNKRRSWVDFNSPAEAEAHLSSQQAKVQRLVAQGFEDTMAQIALQAADGNVDTAILMLKGC